MLLQDKDKLQKNHLLEQEKLLKDLDKEKISAKKKGDKELKKAEKKGYVLTQVFNVKLEFEVNLFE